MNYLLSINHRIYKNEELECVSCSLTFSCVKSLISVTLEPMQLWSAVHLLQHLFLSWPLARLTEGVVFTPPSSPPSDSSASTPLAALATITNGSLLFNPPIIQDYNWSIAFSIIEPVFSLASLAISPHSPREFPLLFLKCCFLGNPS